MTNDELTLARRHVHAIHEQLEKAYALISLCGSRVREADNPDLSLDATLDLANEVIGDRADLRELQKALGMQD